MANVTGTRVSATTARVRTNEQWLADLSAGGHRQAGAIADLQTRLERGLRAYLHNRRDLAGRSVDDLAAMAQDYAQEAILTLRAQLHTFRGESRFTTWAAKLAVNTAISDLRRKRWSDWSLEGLIEKAGSNIPAMTDSAAIDPETQTLRNEIMDILSDVIEHELTAHQRTILLAIQVDEVPAEVVAERLGARRNAVYKALHDARRKLRARIEARGLSIDEVMAAFAAR
jgi:RNA polymerase sigma-70 factor (ECF subfamily)